MSATVPLTPDASVVLIKEAPPSRSTPKWTSPVSILLMLVTGGVFGLAMNRGNVHLPWIIQQQMTLHQFTMMKMFLSALGASGFSVVLFRFIHSQAFIDIQKRRANDPHHVGVLAIGGFLLGIGMTLSGSCPGSVYVQLGAGIPSAWAVFFGVLLGTFLVAIIKPFIISWQEHRAKVDTTLHLSTWLHLIISLSLIGISFLLHTLVQEPIPQSSWNPSIAGLVVGSLQLPLIYVLHKSLGATGSFNILLGGPLHLLLTTTGWKLQWLHLRRIDDKSSFLFAVGIIAGSAIGNSSVPFGSIPSIPASIIGGVFMGLGSNVACGCTSGHGLSGVGLLMNSSIVVLPSIFVGAIGTGLIARSFGYLMY